MNEAITIQSTSSGKHIIMDLPVADDERWMPKNPLPWTNRFSPFGIYIYILHPSLKFVPFKKKKIVTTFVYHTTQLLPLDAYHT